MELSEMHRPAAAGSSPVGGGEKKRGWVQWSSAEARIFFESLNKEGRDWEVILSSLASAGYTKTREQVRHYFYRSLKKINKLLQMVGNDIRIEYKLHRSDGVRALEQFWAIKLEMCADLATIKKEDEAEFARRLRERILLARQNAPPSPPRHGRGKRDSSPSTGTSGSSSSSSSPPRITHAASAKQTVKFVPRYKEQAECLAGEGHNPRLQLIFKASKSIGLIVSHMKRKWISKKAGTTLTSGLRIYPTQDIAINHPGWGEQDTTPVSDIASQLKKQGALTLEYAWPYEWVPPSPNLPSVHPAVHRLAAVSSTTSTAVMHKAPESKDRPLREERDDEVSYFSFGAENSLPSLFNAGASMTGESLTNTRDEEKVAQSFYSGIEQIGTPPKLEPPAAVALDPTLRMPKMMPEPKNKLVMSEDSLMEFPATLSEDTLRELDGHALALTESNSLGITSNIISSSLHAAGQPPAAAPSLLSSEWEVPLFESQGSVGGSKMRLGGPGASGGGGGPDSPPKKKPRPKQ